jgi:hypothetical protein
VLRRAHPSQEGLSFQPGPALGLETVPEETDVDVVLVIVSGGGWMAMEPSFGHLSSIVSRASSLLGRGPSHTRAEMSSLMRHTDHSAAKMEPLSTLSMVTVTSKQRPWRYAASIVHMPDWTVPKIGAKLSHGEKVSVL